jgi:DNA-directed RNA polymerase specialized sigma subunit
VNISAKEFLSQAYRIDQRINAKIEQVQSLRDLAAKATATLSDNSPAKGERNIHRMEDVIIKMVDLENEIHNDISILLGIKKDVGAVIKRVKDPEQQMVLEMRYLCYTPWEKIAEQLAYSPQHTYRIHGAAISSIARELESKCD